MRMSDCLVRHFVQNSRKTIYIIIIQQHFGSHFATSYRCIRCMRFCVCVRISVSLGMRMQMHKQHHGNTRNYNCCACVVVSVLLTFQDSVNKIWCWFHTQYMQNNRMLLIRFVLISRRVFCLSSTRHFRDFSLNYFISFALSLFLHSWNKRENMNKKFVYFSSPHKLIYRL